MCLDLHQKQVTIKRLNAFLDLLLTYMYSLFAGVTCTVVFGLPVIFQLQLSVLTSGHLAILLVLVMTVPKPIDSNTAKLVR